MAINVASQFHVTAALPIDDRLVVADTTARDALASGVRYQGMKVFSIADTTTYILKTGITNSDWATDGGAGGGGTWGSITGTLSSQTDLQTAIDAKVSDTAYDATTWDAVTTIAPSKNAVRDQLELMIATSTKNTRSVVAFTGTAITPGTNMDQTFLYTGTSAQTFTGFGTLSGLTNGTRFRIIGSDQTNTLTINNNDVADGWLTNGNSTLGKGNCISFEYNSTLARMVETGRNF